MKYIKVTKDLGKKETFNQWNGKFLDETSYDQVVKVTDEDAGIMKPVIHLMVLMYHLHMLLRMHTEMTL